MATRLLAQRRMMRMLQVELAKRAGLSISMLSRYEHGWASPTYPTAERLAKALKCGVDALFENLKGQKGDRQ